MYGYKIQQESTSNTYRVSSFIFVAMKSQNHTKQTVIFYVPTLEGGGAEKVFVNLSNHFVNKGFKVIYACAYGDSYTKDIHPAVIIKRCFKNPVFKNKKGNKLSRLICMPFFMIWLVASNRNAHLFTSVLESDMLGNVAHYISKSKGKFIIAQAGLLQDITHPGRLSIFLKWAFFRAHYIVANSPETKESLLNFYHKLDSKIVLIGNPVYEPKQFDDIHKNEKFILNVGRFESQKDHFTLIKAFEIVRKQADIRLKLLGEGALKQDLIKLCKTLNVYEYVDFEGYVEDTDVFYKSATVFALSSTHETFANVIVEAMAFGKPIVSTDCGGPAYIINHSEIGEIVPVKDHKALASGILKVLNNPRNYSAEKIILRAKDFSVATIGDQFLAMIR